MEKKKIDLPVGQKVRGYGLINEYGEFEFTPEQTGARNGQVKVVKTGDGYSVSTSKKRVIVHLNIAKGEKMSMMKNLMGIVTNVLEVIRTYEM